MPGSPHSDSLSTVLPIENSPPGIHTIPAGTGPGAVKDFETVGANVIGPTDGHDSHSAVFGAGGATDERDLEVRIANPITAPTAMRPRATKKRDLALNKVLAGLGLFLDFVCFFIALGKISTSVSIDHSRPTNNRLEFVFAG
jgi:hypothetical protein